MPNRADRESEICIADSSPGDASEGLRYVHGTDFEKHSQQDTATRPKMGWGLRTTALVAGIIVATLLLTARMLTPDLEGFGTHQQLGLPPCTSVVLFDSRCPACGMTTSWALLLRGQIWAALESNIGGAMLAVIGLAYLPASCYFFFGGYPTRSERFSFWLAMSMLLAIGAATVQWIVRTPH